MGFLNFLCIISVSLTQSIGDPSEQHPHFAYNQAYAPRSVVFQDIYSRSGSTIPDDDDASTEEDFLINKASTQFVEFHPQVLKIHRITPPPRYILNSSYVKIKVPSIPSTTHEPDEITIRIPEKQLQRGVLDLLLPPSRVRTFKNVFDTLRRMLSYTFRKRK